MVLMPHSTILQLYILYLGGQWFATCLWFSPGFLHK